MNRQKLAGTLMLLLTAVIWGSAFVAQSVGMDYIGPLTFNGVRSAIGALALIPVMLIFRDRSADKKQTLKAGLICGLIMFAATDLQQIGIQYTTVGKAGFITSFYIVLVPIIGVFMKKRTGPLTWIAVAIALCGLYLLCMKSGELNLGKGDLFVFGSAVLYAMHIVCVDAMSRSVDAVRVSFIQFIITGVLACSLALIFERPAAGRIADAWLPLLYAGVLSCGVAYTLQIVAQKRVPPTAASLIMSLEAVVSVLSGWLLLKQSMSARELTGCVLMFAAVIMIQLKDYDAKRDGGGAKA
ncbi:MAG: DMT family transporter [Oscillospiraceae bacterium]|nr:DMT family transporter [Oscillospiraceae bacterium]